MSAGDTEEYLDCSFVSIHYIICECGETFPSENGLKAHLEKEHPHKRERKEFKCGVCGSIFTAEEDCITHYEESHIVDIKYEQEDEVEEDEVVTKHEPQEYIEEEFGDHVQDDVHEGDEMHEDRIQEDEMIHEDEMIQENEQYEQMADDNLVMDESETHTQQIKQQVPKQILSNPNLTIKQIKPGAQYISQEPLSIRTVKQDKMRVKSVHHDRIVMKPDQILVTAGDGIQEHKILHIPEEYGQLLQVTPDGQLVLIMNNDDKTKPEIRKRLLKGPKKEKSGEVKKLVGKHIVCEVCGKKYASNAALKYHQRVHTGEKPYHCHLCPKKFAMPLFLQIHVRTHTGERPFECPQCPKAFSNKAALLRHDRVHTGEKPYECPMCLKSFTQSNSMKLHVATVHLKQPAPYKSKNRKLKAQERAKAKPVEQIKQENIEDNEDGEAVRHIAVDSSDNMYEVIESEIVSDDQEREVYTIVYNDDDE